MNDDTSTTQSGESGSNEPEKSGGPIIIPLAAFLGALAGAYLGTQMGG